MKTYRTSGPRIITLLIFGTIISLFLALGKSNLKVFVGVEAIFVLMAFAAWAYKGIRFDDGSVVLTTLFFTKKIQPILSIKRVSFASDEDSFGGRTSYAKLEFEDGDNFFLFDFSKTDLREIVERISKTVPDVIDLSIKQHLNKEQMDKRRWQASLRTGDSFLFAAGGVFVLLAVFWWLLQKFWFT